MVNKGRKTSAPFILRSPRSFSLSFHIQIGISNFSCMISLHTIKTVLFCIFSQILCYHTPFCSPNNPRAQDHCLHLILSSFSKYLCITNKTDGSKCCSIGISPSLYLGLLPLPATASQCALWASISSKEQRLALQAIAP